MVRSASAILSRTRAIIFSSSVAVWLSSYVPGVPKNAAMNPPTAFPIAFPVSCIAVIVCGFVTHSTSASDAVASASTIRAMISFPISPQTSLLTRPASVNVYVGSIWSAVLSFSDNLAITSPPHAMAFVNAVCTCSQIALPTALQSPALASATSCCTHSMAPVSSAASPGGNSVHSTSLNDSSGPRPVSSPRKNVSTAPPSFSKAGTTLSSSHGPILSSAGPSRSSILPASPVNASPMGASATTT